MCIVTSQDGLSTGILGANSIMQVIPIPPMSPDAEPTQGFFVNGMPFGTFKTPEAAAGVLEEVKTKLALILSQGTNAGEEPQYQIPADKE